MLKSKSFTLEKPKHSEGWIKIQEWDRRWNKILSIVFGVLSFMLLFAIVLANTMSTAAVLPPSTSAPDLSTPLPYDTSTIDDLTTTETTNPSTLSNTESTTIQDTTLDYTTDPKNFQTYYDDSLNQDHIKFIEFCYMFSCNITCINGRASRITKIVDKLHRKSHCNIVNLEIDGCFFAGRRLMRNWLTTKARINVLKIINSDIRSIDEKAFGSCCFLNLETLVLKNLEIEKMISKNIFKGLEHLQRLELINFPISLFSNEVLVPFARNLKILVFEEMTILQFPVQNITGKFSRNLTSLNYLSLKHNHLTEVNKSSFAALGDITEIDLSDSNIKSIGMKAFDGTKALKKLFLNSNHIESLPEEIFDVILENPGALIDLSQNPFTCDCNLRQLQQYLYDPRTSHKFVLPLTCILPNECWEEFVMDCNICGKNVKPTPTVETTPVSPLSPRENWTNDFSTTTMMTVPWPTFSTQGPPLDDTVSCFHKGAFITLMIMTMFMSASLGAVALFCAIRYCPSLIKRAKFKLTSSKKCTRCEDVAFPPSNPSITPRSSTSKPPFLRSLSDTSLASGRSYLSAINPPRFSNISWRMDKSNYICDNSIYMEENIMDRPPPLPPHPRRNSSLTTNAPSSTRTTYSTVENIYELYE
ncbi:hypothetical protein DMENIID0001_102140 [Sergentomyia squamirostris]